MTAVREQQISRDEHKDPPAHHSVPRVNRRIGRRMFHVPTSFSGEPKATLAFCHQYIRSTLLTRNTSGTTMIKYPTTHAGKKGRQPGTTPNNLTSRILISVVSSSLSVWTIGGE